MLLAKRQKNTFKDFLKKNLTVLLNMHNQNYIALSGKNM